AQGTAGTASPVRGGDGRKTTHSWRTLSDRRGLSGCTSSYATCARDCAWIRSPGDVGDRCSSHRAVAMEHRDRAAVKRSMNDEEGMNTLRTPAQLVSQGFVPAETLPEIVAVANRYAVTIPPALAALIDKSDPQDPIARQVVP